MKVLQVVVGGQYGSEAKGHVAAQLAKRSPELLAVRVAGPNAGHTVVADTGEPYALRQIPVAAVANPNAALAIAAGSEIDPDVLLEEVQLLDKAGFEVSQRLSIDPQATWLEPQHRRAEAAAELTQRIGSTGKGIGAARAARLMRAARLAGQCEQLLDAGLQFRSVRTLYDRHWDIQIEGTQGYGLGLHTDHYPKVTSSDCTALDFLAMAQCQPWMRRRLQIWVVLRPYPIRVAGDSGPLLGETSWQDLGLAPEYTTVTKKMRRVGVFDERLASDAIRANGGPGAPAHVAFTMMDQVAPSLTGCTDRDELLGHALFQEWAMRIRLVNAGTGPELVTTSDRTAVWLQGWH